MQVERIALVLLNDLMFQVKIAEAAKHSFFRTVFVNTEAKLLEFITKQRPVVIIIDLNIAGINPLLIIRNLKASAETQAIPLLGYISHVQVALRAEATQAGCNIVLARSAIIQKLPELLADFKAAAISPLEED